MKFKEIITEFSENFILFFIFLVSLTSIFFLPNNPWIMLSKQYFIIDCACFLLIFWSAWILLNKKFSLVGKKLVYIFPIIFLLSSLISALFSLYRHGSFWGNESWSLSLLSIASLLVIFFVIINYLDKEKFKKFLYVFLSSIALAQIIFLLFVAKVFTFSWMNPNLIGQNISIAFISALSLIVSAGLFIYYLHEKKSALQKVFLIILSIFSIIILLIINIRSAWSLAVLGAILLMLFTFLREKKVKIKLFIFPVLIIILSIIFIAVGRLESFAQADTEILPNQATSLKIAKEAFFDRPLQGVGINNYSIAYNFYRPNEINQTAFWSNTFYYSSSKILDVWSTGGLITLLSYLAFLFYFSFLAIKSAINKKQDKILISLAAAWLVYVAGNFLMMSNLVVDLFAIFLLAGIIIYSWQKKRRKKIKPVQKYFVIIIASVLLLGSILILCLSIKRFVASQAFFQARKYAFDVNLQPQIPKWVEFASSWDKKNDNYQRQLASLYIIEINNLKSIQLDESKQPAIEKELQKFIEKANTAAAKAVELNPNNFLNHLVLADFYNATLNLASNALVWAEKSLSNAVDTFPNNVFIINSLAENQLTQARQLMVARANLSSQNQDTNELDFEINELLAASRQNAQKAIGLKNDYLPAYYNLALSEWELGNLDTSIDILENLQNQAPNDIGIKFYLALMYDQAEQTEKAIDLLKQSVSLAPNFSDGYWALARIYQAMGETSLAKQNLEKILEYDPQNENVKAVLQNLSQIQKEPEIIASEDIPTPSEPEKAVENEQN